MTTGATNQRTQVDFFDCTGKPDGNYVHPHDCTMFMSCVAGQYAYERMSADCHVDPDNCPTGRLHYDHAQNACLWSYEAGCVTDPAGAMGVAPNYI
ncbi:chitin binding peritrophin-A domain-containing protein [Nocardia sp. XZ_19_385]|uniref:chitin binding peritrophin-A domain-containing protein n=1 Tax=Nocardia sp. XZ_19_385 TaxID=2769488 RepID=UPI00188DFE9C|nr:chitin binding peritrophin-A domain-containing protein [Nocardia sp. XZ_19_385]